MNGALPPSEEPPQATSTSQSLPQRLQTFKLQQQQLADLRREEQQRKWQEINDALSNFHITPAAEDQNFAELAEEVRGYESYISIGHPPQDQQAGEASSHSLRRWPRASAAKKNERTAARNGQLFRDDPDAVLQPLRCPGNGQVIFWFPDSLPELRKTGENALNQIVLHLDDNFDFSLHREAKIEWISRRWVKLDF